MSISLTDQERLELEYLRYFYAEVDDGLGPASGEIYQMIEEAYVKGGGELPDAYKPEDYDEDEA